MKTLSLIALLVVSVAARADSPPSPFGQSIPADPPPLAKRVSDLEKENAALKARVAALEGKTVAVAAGVATPAPFEPCGPAGCSTTPTTLVTGAGTPATVLTYGLLPSAGAGTSTGARGAGTYGGTSSGCANGACAAPVRTGFFRRR